MTDDAWWAEKFLKLQTEFSMAMLEYECQNRMCEWWGTGNTILKRCPKCGGKITIHSDEGRADKTEWDDYYVEPEEREGNG